MLSDMFYNVSPSDRLTKLKQPIKPGLLTAYGIQVLVAELLMPDGKSLERVGISPDEPLLPQPEDIANKRDPVLARAAAILGANIDPEKAGALMESLLSAQSHQPKQ
jgi:C-terminal processing protease CtpA/Prc